jgi:hypothetical protein
LLQDIGNGFTHLSQIRGGGEGVCLPKLRLDLVLGIKTKKFNFQTLIST